MTVKLWESPDSPFKSTLDGRLSSTDTTIVLVSADGLVAPGVVVIDRQDGQGDNTFNKMEFCSFTGITQNTLTGVTRGIGGGVAAADHNSGALVEEFIDTTHWNDLGSFLRVEHTTAGNEMTSNHVRMLTATGVSGATGLKGDLVFLTGNNVSIYPISGISGYNMLGITMGAGTGGLSPFVISGGVASITSATPAMIIEDGLSIKSASAMLLGPASGASLIIDINKNFTTMFTNQATRLTIPGGGTYASTASIAVTSLTPGNIITMDIDSVSNAFDLKVVLET